MKKYKNLYKLINTNAQITSILASGYRRHCVIPNILGQFDGRIMLWQTSNIYFPCNREQLFYGTNLKSLYDLHKNDFDMLIVDSFPDDFNSKETIELIEYIKTDKDFLNKKFVFIFSVPKSEKEFGIDNYKNYKELIGKFSDDIFLLKKTETYGVFNLENYKTKESTKYEYDVDESMKDFLKKVKDE